MLKCPRQRARARERGREREGGREGEREREKEREGERGRERALYPHKKCPPDIRPRRVRGDSGEPASYLKAAVHLLSDSEMYIESCGPRC